MINYQCAVDEYVKLRWFRRFWVIVDLKKVFKQCKPENVLSAEDELSQSSSTPKRHRLSSANCQSPSVEQVHEFYQKISKSKYPPAILKITMPYANQFIPNLCNPAYPKPITELYNPEMLHENYLSITRRM